MMAVEQDLVDRAQAVGLEAELCDGGRWRLWHHYGSGSVSALICDRVSLLEVSDEVEVYERAAFTRSQQDDLSITKEVEMTGNANTRLWTICQRGKINLDEAAEQAATTPATARKWARLWRLAGIATVDGRGKGATVELVDRAQAPPIITFDSGGKTAGVSPDDGAADWFVTINDFADPPEVTRRRKSVPGPAGVIDAPSEEVPEPPAPPVPAIDRGVGVLDEQAANGTGPAPAARSAKAVEIGRLREEARWHAEQWAGAMQQAVHHMLQVGHRLLQLKEQVEHGHFAHVVQDMGLSERHAREAMSAARKMLDHCGELDPKTRALADLTSTTKVYQLSLLDADDLEALDAGGEVPGIGTLADVEKMSTRELTAAIRRERAERRAERQDSEEREAAQRERLAKKDEQIARMQDDVDFHRRTAEKWRSGRTTWMERDTMLHAQAALLDRNARDLCENFEEGLKRLRAHAADRAGHDKMGDVPLNIAPHDAACARLKQQLWETYELLGGWLTEIGEQLSVPLETEASTELH